MQQEHHTRLVPRLHTWLTKVVMKLLKLFAPAPWISLPCLSSNQHEEIFAIWVFCAHLAIAQSSGFCLSSASWKLQVPWEAVCLTGRSLARSSLFYRVFACLNFRTEHQQASGPAENESLIPVGLEDTVKPPKRFLFFPTSAILNPGSIARLPPANAGMQPVTGSINKASSFRWLWFGIQRIVFILTD